MHYRPYDINFLGLAAGHSLDIYDLLAPNTFVNTFPNRDEASEMSDLGTYHFLIVRRLKVINEPLDHLILHHGGLHLCS